MPHLSDASASGAASSTRARSASTTGRSGAGCFAKNPAMGAPKSARGPCIFAAGAFALAAFAFVGFAFVGFAFVGFAFAGFAFAGFVTFFAGFAFLLFA